MHLVFLVMMMSLSFFSLAASPITTPSLPPKEPSAPLAPLALPQIEEDSDYALYAKSPFASPKWDSLVAAGFKSYASGNSVQAVEFLQKAVAAGATSPFITFKLAASYEFLGNFYTAVQYYTLTEKELEHLPHDHLYYTHFYESYARALLANKQQAEAIPFLEKAAPTSREYWVLSTLADYYLSQNNPDAALPLLLRAVQVPGIQQIPNTAIAELYLVISRIYLSQGKRDEAYQYADYAVQTDPRNQDALRMKNQMEQDRQRHKMQQQMDKMIDWYE